MYQCLHACVCCCWTREVKDVNNKRKLQQSCTSDTWYKKRILSVHQDGDHCPLTFFYLKGRTSPSRDMVTWPASSRWHSLVLSVFRAGRRAVSRWRCRRLRLAAKTPPCALSHQKVLVCPVGSVRVSCSVLVQPVHGATAPCRWTSCNRILFLSYHSILIRAFFLLLVFNCSN